MWTSHDSYSINHTCSRFFSRWVMNMCHTILILSHWYKVIRWLDFLVMNSASIVRSLLQQKTLLTCLSKVTSSIHIIVYIISKRLPILQSIKMTFTHLFLVSNINGPVSLSRIDFRTYLTSDEDKIGSRF